MSKTILGLDIGTNSIGWALLGCDDDGEPNSIIKTGVRVFQEAVDAESHEPKNLKRRMKRLSRRTLRRRVKRKKRVAELLLIHHFFK
ncbi:MAG: hypothetical protein N2450_08440, partial [bacterium]|nr:hypothetical protein [bacterium]